MLKAMNSALECIQFVCRDVLREYFKLKGYKAVIYYPSSMSWCLHLVWIQCALQLRSGTHRYNIPLQPGHLNLTVSRTELEVTQLAQMRLKYLCNHRQRIMYLENRGWKQCQTRNLHLCDTQAKNGECNAFPFLNLLSKTFLRISQFTWNLETVDIFGGEYSFLQPL